MLAASRRHVRHEGPCSRVYRCRMAALYILRATSGCLHIIGGRWRLHPLRRSRRRRRRQLARDLLVRSRLPHRRHRRLVWPHLPRGAQLPTSRAAHAARLHV